MLRLQLRPMPGTPALPSVVHKRADWVVRWLTGFDLDQQVDRPRKVIAIVAQVDGAHLASNSQACCGHDRSAWCRRVDAGVVALNGPDVI